MPSLHHCCYLNRLASPRDCAMARALPKGKGSFAWVAWLPAPRQCLHPCHLPSLEILFGFEGTLRGRIPSLHHTFHAVWLASMRDHATASASLNDPQEHLRAPVASAQSVDGHTPPCRRWLARSCRPCLFGVEGTLRGHMPSSHHPFHPVELARLRDCATARASPDGRNLFAWIAWLPVLSCGHLEAPSTTLQAAKAACRRRFVITTCTISQR